MKKIIKISLLINLICIYPSISYSFMIETLISMSIHEIGHIQTNNIEKIDFSVVRDDQFYLFAETYKKTLFEINLDNIINNNENKFKKTYTDLAGDMFSQLLYEYSLIRYRQTNSNFYKKLTIINSLDQVFYSYFNYGDYVNIANNLQIDNRYLQTGMILLAGFNIYRFISNNDFISINYVYHPTVIGLNLNFKF